VKQANPRYFQHMKRLVELKPICWK